MKSALRNDLERLRRDAISERHRHAFEAGRAEQPAIAAHADAASVLAMLDDEAEGTYASREALTEALTRNTIALDAIRSHLDTCDAEESRPRRASRIPTGEHLAGRP